MTDPVSAILKKPGGQVFAVRVPARMLTSKELNALRRSMAVWAMDPELPEFNLADALFLMREMRKLKKATAKEV